MGNREPARLLVYADSRDYSGAESVFCEVVGDLTKREEFEIVLAAPAGESLLTSRLEQAARRKVDYPVPSQGPFLAGVTLPLSARRVHRALEGIAPDIALVNLPSAEYGSSPLLSPALSEVPTVGLLHIDHSLKEAGFRLGGLRERVARRALGRLDGVCLVSDAAVGRYRDAWGPGKTNIRQVRYPSPRITATPKEEARAALGFDHEARLVGIVGRISLKQKGHDTLLQSVAILAEREPNLAVVVAGDGPDRERLVRMIGEAGLKDRFHLIGQIDDVGLFLSAIDLIAIPSRFEGLPLVALEALQVGVPGVVSEIDGLIDVWPGEWRVPASDPEALVEGLERILVTDPSRVAELVEEGRRLAASRQTTHPGEDVADVLLETLSASR